MRIDRIKHIYSQPLEIRLDRLQVKRLSLNRHQPEADWIEQHSHRFSQFLVYLHGRGIQQIDGVNTPVKPGSVCHLPPGVPHAFVQTEGQRPLCLAIDYRNPKVGVNLGKVVAARQLTQAEMQKIRRALAGLRRWHPEKVGVEPLEAAAVLQIMDVLLRFSGELKSQTKERMDLPIVRRVRKVIAAEMEVSSGEIANRMAYNRDHLNRLLKEAAGVTISQLRDEIRLKKATQLLMMDHSVSTAAVEMGFNDVNYFSRWFRKQTGQTPSEYRREARRM